MIYQKIIQLYIFLRDLVMRFIFGKITMINYNQTYYPVPFFLPYFISFFLEFVNLKYVYYYDEIHHYQDYINDIKILPPIMKFKIDDKDVSSSIKNYKSNIPIIYFLFNYKLLNTKNTELSYWKDGSIKNKEIKNLEIYNSLNDIFD